MEGVLSDLDLRNPGVIFLSLLPAAINLGIFFYIIFRFANNHVNNALAAFVALLALGQLTDGIFRMSTSEAVAEQWIKLSSLPWALIGSFGLLFCLDYSGWIKREKRNVYLLFLFLPSVTCLCLTILGLEKFDIKSSPRWNWIANPRNDVITSIIYAWISLQAIAMMVVLWIHTVRVRKNGKEQTRSLLLAGGITLPIIVGLVGEVFLPFFFGSDDIPVTTPTITIFSFAAIISIRRYSLLDFSPQHQWDRIVENMNEGLLIVDNNDAIMYANQTFCELTGYKLAELKGRIANEFLIEEKDRKSIMRALDERLERKSGEYEIRLRKKNGEMVWVRMSGSPYLDEHGNVIGSIGLQTNIQESKEAEAKLIHSEENLKKAQAIAHVGHWEYDLKTRVVYWSDEMCRIYGAPLQQKSRRSEDWLNQIHPDDRKRVISEYLQSRRGLKSASIYHRIIHSNGEIRHLHSVNAFECNEKGEPIMVRGICHDITEMHEMQYALSEAEAKAYNFINESMLAVYFADPQSFKVTYANQAFLDLLGYERADLRTLTVFDFVTHSREDIDSRIQILYRGDSFPVSNRRWKRKDGTEVEVVVSASLMKDKGKDRLCLAAQDVTLLKVTENKLIRANKEMELYIYKASHDLRAPISSMLGLINVGRKDITDKKALQYITMIEDLAQRLDKTLASLRTSMAIRNLEATPDVIDLKEVVYSVIANFHHNPGFMRLKTKIVDRIQGTVRTNRFLVETIIQNLIENAIKYQDITKADSYMTITLCNKEGGICIQVEDNGKGIDAKAIDHIFEMYYRGTSESSGSGLGLYLVRSGVDKLGGKIEVESKPGLETIFRVRLPLAA